MSVWNRLFGQSQSSRSVSTPAAGGRLRVEALETREVPSAVAAPAWTHADGGPPLDGGAATAQSRPATPALTAAPADPVAASDYLIIIDSIPGESKDDAHKETIEIASWSLGATGADVRLTTPPADPLPASDHLLTLDAPKGESKDGAHKETVEIASWSLSTPNGGIWR